MALRRLERLNPERLKYEMVFAKGGPGGRRSSRGPTGSSGSPRARTGRTVGGADRLHDRSLQQPGRPVRRIILFGSRVRGDARPDSDYDLLVVLPKLAPPSGAT